MFRNYDVGYIGISLHTSYKIAEVEIQQEMLKRLVLCLVHNYFFSALCVKISKVSTICMVTFPENERMNRLTGTTSVSTYGLSCTFHLLPLCKVIIDKSRGEVSGARHN